MSDFLGRRALAAQSHAVLAASIADGALEIARLNRECSALKQAIKRMGGCVCDTCINEELGLMDAKAELLKAALEATK